jgi:hypothetical protein
MDDTQAPAKMKPEEIATLWTSRLTQAEQSAAKWRRRGEKISNIYRSQSPSMQATSNDESPGDKPTFNIFWSNTETLAPATYSRRPKVEAYRRFHDEDPIGRVAGLILERAIQYEIDCKQDFHLAMKQVVKDRLLPGLGQVWIRYEPTFQKEQSQEPDPANPLEVVSKEIETVKDEFTPVDYVYWKDFIISPARTWGDVRWVARKLMFSKDSLKARFEGRAKEMGWRLDEVPFDYDPSQSDPQSKTSSGEPSDTQDKRAIVYEIWNKDNRQAIWICRGVQAPLDIVDDVSQLEDYFPCPQPLLATTTNDEILPVADYIYYQDQIRELNRVSARINLLVSSLRLMGVYDSSCKDIATLFSGGMENKLIPVNSWAAFAEKGGLKGAMDFVPLEMVAKILQGLYESRDQLKQEVYEITGMADVIRGASAASETLGAQEIKAKFANLRLSSRQQQVAQFVTQVLRIKGELICRHYSSETLIRISSAEQLPEVKQWQEQMAAYQQAQQAFQQAQMAPPQPGPDGQPPQQPQPPGPPPPNVLEQALQLLKDERTRNYRIEVASDSMVELEEVDERARRNEFMSTVSNFFNAMKNVTAIGPQMVPVALEMLRFVVRGFSVGRALEASIEDASAQIQQQMKNPPPPQPPESIQVAQIKESGATQRTKDEIESRERIEEMKTGYEKFSAEQGQRHEQMMQFLQGQQADGQQRREQQAQAQAAEKEQQAQAQATGQQQQFEMLSTLLQNALAPQEEKEDQRLAKIEEGQQQVLEAIQQLAQLMSKPRRRVPKYNAAGDIESVDDTLIQ